LTTELFGGGTQDLVDGKRAEVYDDILNVAESVFAPEGKKQSKWIDTGEFEEFAEKYGQQDSCFGFGDKSGMTLETPFGDNSVLLRFLTNVPHPQLGNGLLVTTQMMWSFATPYDTCVEASFLNFLESRRWTDFPQFGCWHPEPNGDGIVHTCFVPNTLYMPGLVTNLAIWAVARVQWVRRERFPKVEDLTMAQILKNRFGSSS